MRMQVIDDYVCVWPSINRLNQQSDAIELQLLLWLIFDLLNELVRGRGLKDTETLPDTN